MLKPFRTFAVFVARAVSGDLLLLAASVLALLLANSRYADRYFAALHAPGFGLSPLDFINDGLMAIFFLLVGLEIKREWSDGALQNWPDRILPGFAALGGMIVPCLIFLALNARYPDHLRGWAIPAATDIAFALGVLAIVRRHVPGSLKVFLTALAILDDLGAILIIALFYAGHFNLVALGGAGAVLIGLFGLNRFGVKALTPYLAGFVLLWLCLLNSGLHATMAGVLTAFFVPMQGSGHSPLQRLEHFLAPLVALIIVPVFGFANAGVVLGGLPPGTVFGPVALGVGLGLFLGKQIGVFSFAAAAIKFGFAPMPREADWRQLYGIAVLCGIGFTMGLFIDDLAFAGQADLRETAKLGILAGSLLSALGGLLVLRRIRPA